MGRRGRRRAAVVRYGCIVGVVGFVPRCREEKEENVRALVLTHGGACCHR